MYGPPPVMSPVPPPRGGRVTPWRVVAWVLLGGCLVGGVGVFACVPLAVLAVRGRSKRDALIAVGALSYTVFTFWMYQLELDKNHPSGFYQVLSVGLLAQGVAALVYYIRRDRRLLAAGQQPVVGPLPAYPPYQSYPAQPPIADAQPPIADAQPLVADAVPPMPAQPHRLGQVRAELDELSDYLRREQGR